MELHDRTITTTTTRTIAVTPQTLRAKDVIDVMIVALSLCLSPRYRDVDTATLFDQCTNI